MLKGRGSRTSGINQNACENKVRLRARARLLLGLAGLLLITGPGPGSFALARDSVFIGPQVGQNAGPKASSDYPDPMAGGKFQAEIKTGVAVGPVTGIPGKPGSISVSAGNSGGGAQQAPAPPSPPTTAAAPAQTQPASPLVPQIAPGPPLAGPIKTLGPIQADPQRLWTIVVYMDGDNNLEPYALKDVVEMAGALPPQGVEVIILMDRAEGYTEAAGDWKDTRAYRLVGSPGGKAQGLALAKPGELNMGDPAVLQSFLASALKTFPAQRHALIMWNHGGGWASHANDEKAPGAPGEYDKLTLPELRQALSGALGSVGLPKLDLIGFDMCLMAQLETACELEGLAQVMVGSEAVEPGEGWPYEKIIPLFAQPGLGTRDIAKGIVSAYDRFYRVREEPIATQSALDLTQVGDFINVFDSFLTKLEPDLPRLWPAFTRTLFFSDGYSDLADVRKGPGALLSVDLGDALKNLAQVDPAMAKGKEYAALKQALDSFVIDCRNSPKHRNSQGLSIYAPFRPDLLNKDYRHTRFAQKSRWVPILAKLYQLQEGNPTQPKISGIQTYSLLRDKPVPDVLQLGQDGFAFDFDGTNVLWSFAFLGGMDRQKPRTLIFQKSILRRQQEQESQTVENQDRQALLQAYSYPDGPHRVGFRYDGSRKMVSNGEKTLPATMDESDVNNLGSFLTVVPAVFEHPQMGKFFCQIYFNWLWRAVALIAQVPQKDGSYIKTRIDPPPESTIHLLMEAISDKGDMTYASTGSMKWGQGLYLVLDLAPPGEYQVSLAVETLSGKFTSAKHKFLLKERGDLKDLLKAAPDELILDNFIGEWEFIDAQAWFKQGQMVSMGAFAKYEPHPKMKNVLRLTLEKPKGKNVYPGTEIVEVVQAGGLPLMRQFVLDGEGVPRPDYGFRLGLPLWDQKGNQYLMLSMDLATGEMQVKVKRSGPRPRLKPGTGQGQAASIPQSPQGQQQPQGQQPGTGQQPASPQAGQDGSLQGTWTSAEGEGLAFEGNQWAYYEQGQVTDGGTFQVQGQRIIVQSQASGATMEFRFRISGGQLLIQDSYGQVTAFRRVQ